MRTLGVIIARGGSRRIPKKNIHPVGGKPLLAWSVEAAIASNVCGRVLLSTDDPEMAKIAIAHGAEAPFLRDAANDDRATASEAGLAALSQAEAHWGESYDALVLLMPTCPLRTGDLIRAQFEAFQQCNAPFLLSCADFGPTKPWWAFQMDELSQPRYLHPEALKTRSQELAKLYAPSGATWIASVPALRAAGTFYGPGYRFFPIAWIHAIDIDELSDIRLCDWLLRNDVKSLLQVAGHGGEPAKTTG
jgi:CMP-N-acetylneuraminic acid synthetase